MDEAEMAVDPREDEILAIVARETAIDRQLLVPEAQIAELGIASIDLTLAVFELEKHFNIEIPVVASGSGQASGAEFSTVGDLVRHVMTTIDQQRAA
jgi:acyl carrier protein